MDFSTIFWDEAAAGDQAMYHDNLMPTAAMLTSTSGPPERTHHMMDTTQALVDLVAMNQNSNYFSSNSDIIRGGGGGSCPYIHNMLGMASASRTITTPVSFLSNINHHQPLVVSAPFVRASPSEAAAATTTALHAGDLSQYFSELGRLVARTPSSTELLEQQRQLRQPTTGTSSFDSMDGNNNINNDHIAAIDHYSNPHHHGLNNNWLGLSSSNNNMESSSIASAAAASAGADLATARIRDLSRHDDSLYLHLSNPSFSSDSADDGLNIHIPPLFSVSESQATTVTTPRLCSRRGRSSSSSHIGAAAAAGSNSRDRLARAMRNVADEERERQAIIRRLRVAAVAAAQRPSRSLPLAFNNMSRADLASATGYNLQGDEDESSVSLLGISRADRLATADELLDAEVLDDAMGPSPAPCPSWSSLGGMTARDDIPDGNLTPLEFLAQTRPGAEDCPSPPPSRRTRRPTRRAARSTTAADRRRHRLTSEEEFVASLHADSLRFANLNNDSLSTVEVKRESDSELFAASSEISRPASGGSLGSIQALTKKSSSAGTCTSKEASDRTKPEDDLELVEVKPEPDLDKKIAAAPAEEDLSLCSGISCCICLDLSSKKDLSMINGCKHKFCFECIEKWSDRENTCPLCKERFGKIERVYKAPRRSKKRKSDDPETAAARNKNSKRVKNRSQRADYSSGSALHGLLQGMESGALPQSLAHFIFSNIPGGLINGLARGSVGAPPPHGAPRSGAAAPAAGGPVWYYPHNASTLASRGPATARAASARAGASSGTLPSSTTFRFRAGGSHDPLLHQLDSFNLMGGPAGGGGSSHSFLDDELQGDSDFEDLQSSHSSHHVMPPWINPFYSTGVSRGARASGVTSMPPARSYAANHNEVNAGSSAANALEIVDSDDEDEIIEMVVTHT
jgi:hypothetical protein